MRIHIVKTIISPQFDPLIREIQLSGGCDGEEEPDFPTLHRENVRRRSAFHLDSNVAPSLCKKVILDKRGKKKKLRFSPEIKE